MTDRIDTIEERLAHLMNTVDDLSDIVATQANELTTLRKHVSLLMTREASRESDASGAMVMGDERPPHY